MIERLVGLYRRTSSRAALATLVAANVVPLVGVVAWGWDLPTILVLYWIENGIVGLFTVPKILLAAGPTELSMPMTGTRIRLGPSIPTFPRLQKAVIVPFFAVHYGMFWVVHGVFVFAISAGLFSPGFDSSFVGPAWELVAIGAVGLLGSHAVSFGLNYLGRREYLATTPTGQMAAPYGRVVILHLTILFGAIAIGAIGSPVGAIAVLVVVKTVVDVAAHLAEHRRAAERVVVLG